MNADRYPPICGAGEKSFYFNEDQDRMRPWPAPPPAPACVRIGVARGGAATRSRSRPSSVSSERRLTPDVTAVRRLGQVLFDEEEEETALDAEPNLSPENQAAPSLEPGLFGWGGGLLQTP